MTTIRLGVGALLLGACGVAADAPKPAPQITPQQLAKFWRAQAEAVTAQAQAEKAKAAFDAAVEALKKACGDQQVIIGQDGEPTCAPKPEPSKAAAK